MKHVGNYAKVEFCGWNLLMESAEEQDSTEEKDSAEV